MSYLPAHHMLKWWLAAGVLALSMSVHAWAQPAGPARKTSPPPPDHSTPTGVETPSRKEALELEAQAVKAFSEQRFADAEVLLRRQLEIQPGNYVIFYNLACARTAQGDAAHGMEFLVKAVEGGFDDLREMQKDPSLRPLRELADYKRIVEHWPELLEARRDANVESVLEFFSKSYRVERDERLRLVFVTGVNKESVAAARQEISKLGEWASKDVFPGLLDEPECRNDPWVVVVLPPREDFLKWVVSRHGEGAITGVSSIGGEYDHDTKILVAQDLGSSLRHEFFHVLHWRSCMRLGQRHAFWVQEGLCSLVEDYSLAADGTVTPERSWRTNIVKRLERAGQLPPLADLCTMPAARFMGTRVLASYARARTAFMFLSEHGKLGEWYRNYTATYEQDRAGVKAWELTMNSPIKQIDLTMRGWVRRMAMVPEEIGPGMASLGVEVEGGGADGLTVTAVTGRRHAIAGPLQPGDVITDIDGHSTRDMAELVRVLGTYKPGDEVAVGIRRGSKVKTETVALIAKKPRE